MADYFVSRFGVVLVVIVGVLGASLSACVSEDAKSPKTAGGIVLAAGSWMTLPAAFVDVHYLPEYKTDADLYVQFFEVLHQALRVEFAPFQVDMLLREPVRCGVWLHPGPSRQVAPSSSGRSFRISAGTGLARTSYGGTTTICELHFLTPAAFSARDRCCTKVGESRDVDQLRRVAAHEYSTILLERISRQRAGWRFHSAPAWFVQGYEEYLGCILAGDRTRTITLGKYRELVARTPSRLGDGEVADPYIDGAILVDFLHAEFGRERVQALMSNPAGTFDEALREELGVSQRALFTRARARFQKGTPTSENSPNPIDRYGM